MVLTLSDGVLDAGTRLVAPSGTCLEDVNTAIIQWRSARPNDAKLLPGCGQWPPRTVREAATLDGGTAYPNGRAGEAHPLIRTWTVKEKQAQMTDPNMRRISASSA